jgi:hypothetical protein
MNRPEEAPHMKFIVTAVAISRKTRRRVGKARTEVIDTATNTMFDGVTDASAVEVRYEAFWNDVNPDSPDIVKVVDVREVE